MGAVVMLHFESAADFLQFTEPIQVTLMHLFVLPKSIFNLVLFPFEVRQFLRNQIVFGRRRSLSPTPQFDN
jgi:hypothetical protein